MEDEPRLKSLHMEDSDADDRSRKPDGDEPPEPDTSGDGFMNQSSPPPWFERDDN